MKLEHPNFKTASNNPQEQKVHVVDNLSNDKLNIPKELLHGPPKVSALADDPIIKEQLKRKSVLEKLVMFREPEYKLLNVQGSNFRFKILTAEDNNKVYSKIRSLPKEEQITRSPIIMLAASLVDVDGVKIEEIYSGPQEITDPMEQKYYELSQWNMPLINTLISAYSKYTEELEKGYSSDFLK